MFRGLFRAFFSFSLCYFRSVGFFSCIKVLTKGFLLSTLWHHIQITWHDRNQIWDRFWGPCSAKNPITGFLQVHGLFILLGLLQVHPPFILCIGIATLPWVCTSFQGNYFKWDNYEDCCFIFQGLWIFFNISFNCHVSKFTRLVCLIVRKLLQHCGTLHFQRLNLVHWSRSSGRKWDGKVLIHQRTSGIFMAVLKIIQKFIPNIAFRLKL